jgi:hypothetical protein
MYKNFPNIFKQGIYDSSDDFTRGIEYKSEYQCIRCEKEYELEYNYLCNYCSINLINNITPKWHNFLNLYVYRFHTSFYKQKTFKQNNELFPFLQILHEFLSNPLGLDFKLKTNLLLDYSCSDQRKYNDINKNYFSKKECRNILYLLNLKLTEDICHLSKIFIIFETLNFIFQNLDNCLDFLDLQYMKIFLSDISNSMIYNKLCDKMDISGIFEEWKSHINFCLSSYKSVCSDQKDDTKYNINNNVSSLNDNDSLSNDDNNSLLNDLVQDNNHLSDDDLVHSYKYIENGHMCFDSDSDNDTLLEAQMSILDYISQESDNEDMDNSYVCCSQNRLKEPYDVESNIKYFFNKKTDYAELLK